MFDVIKLKLKLNNRQAGAELCQAQKKLGLARNVIRVNLKRHRGIVEVIFRFL